MKAILELSTPALNIVDKETIFIDNHHHIAIYLDAEKKQCFSCELHLDGSLHYGSTGLLKELDEDITYRVQTYFSVDIKEYGVKSIDNTKHKGEDYLWSF